MALCWLLPAAPLPQMQCQLSLSPCWLQGREQLLLARLQALAELGRDLLEVQSPLVLCLPLSLLQVQVHGQLQGQLQGQLLYSRTAGGCSGRGNPSQGSLSRPLPA